MSSPPKVFENERILRLLSSDYRSELTKLDLEAFPIIDDFKVEIFNTKTFMGFHLRFTSKNLGVLTGFPWWDNVDDMMTQAKGFTPLGTIDKPFEDADESWQILIWEYENFVYIMEGEEPACKEFQVWFKIDKNVFLNEWDEFKGLTESKNYQKKETERE
jgi:hypothetical protein